MNSYWLSTAIEPDKSVGFTLTVVIAGLGIVLTTLALLIVIFYFFGKIVSVSQNRNKKNKSSQQQPDNHYPDISEMKAEELLIGDEEGIPPEVIAVISAAVCAYEGKSAVVTSVRKKRPRTSSVNEWARAAMIENTRPF